MSDNPVLAAIDRLGSTIEQLRGDVTQLHGDVTQLRGDVTQLRVDVMERLDQQGDRLNTLHEDITVAMSATEQSHRVQKNAREDLTGLTEMVSALHRLVHRLEGRVSALEEARF